MRAFLLCPVIIVTACGSDGKGFWDDRPVDGTFRVSIERPRDTCSDGSYDYQDLTYMDWFLRLDGRYDVSHGAFDLALPFTMNGVRWTGGNVEYELHEISSGTTYDYVMTGTVTPDALDLAVDFKGYEGCEQEIRLTGTPWPIADPSSLEGYYALGVTPLGNTCDAAATPGPQWNQVSTVWLRSDGSRGIGLIAGMTATVGPPTGDGSVNWTGETTLPMGMFPLPLPATLSGTLTPTTVDLEFAHGVPLQDPADACMFRYRMAGAKRIPSVDAVDNDYRMHYEVENGCATADDGKRRSLDAPARLVTQPDGWVSLTDPFGDVRLAPSGDELMWVEGDPATGYELTYHASAAPPSFGYVLQYRAYDEALALQCEATVTATGLVRYVFE